MSYVKKIKKFLSKKIILKNVLFTKNLMIFLIFLLKDALSKKKRTFLTYYEILEFCGAVK